MNTGGTIYKDKWNVSFSVELGECYKMAEWITEQLDNHWSQDKPQNRQ